VATVYDGTRLRFFINGIDAGSVPKTGNVTKASDYSFQIAYNSAAVRYWKGFLDEIRVSNVARSSNWMWACYMNQASNGTFAGSFNTYGAVEAVNPALPQIVNIGSPRRTDTSADVVGRLLTNGTSAATVYLYWATTDCTTNASAWEASGSVSNLGTQVDGTTVTNTLTGLASNTTYYWNYSAQNVSGTVWGATAGSPSFRTFGPPELTNGLGATAVDAIGATENGVLLKGTTARVFILFGAQDGVWSVTNDLGTLGEGTFSNAVIGLTPETTYYYTCYATNTYGSAWVVPSVAFTTLTSVVNTWTGGGTSSNASEAANWSGGVPVRGNTIVLDGTSSKSLRWNAGSNGLPGMVAAWRQTALYTGTVTFATVYGPAGFTNFTISGDCAISNGVWTHLANGSTESYLLRVTVGGSLLITNATINGNALGCTAGNGPGAPGAGSDQGGAYGGATGSGSAFNHKTYGSVTAPTRLGSGGGYGTGGGAIVLTVAKTTTVASAGLLTAVGNAGLLSAGSGGSIFLTTGWLKGNGTLRANGGSGGGNGAGGRVAIVLTGAGADFADWQGTNTAYAGGGSGAAGTVYRRTAAGVDTLILDNNDYANNGQVATILTNGVNLNSFSNVVIARKAILGIKGDTVVDLNTFNPTLYGAASSGLTLDSATNVTYPAHWNIDRCTVYLQGITNIPASVTIGTNGVLSCYQNSSAEAYKLNTAIGGNLTVLSNGLITVDGRGFGAATGPGAASSGSANGGAHGGVSGGSSNTYGWIMAPTNFGSGGGYDSGGGAILLTVAGTTTVAAAGAISANGTVGLLSAGSGGSIWLTTGWLTGAGAIRATGGNGSASGGRVAIVLTGAGADFSAWTGANAAYGGASAAAGTVYRKTADVPAGGGAVTVDNANAATNATFTSLPAFRNSTENLTKTLWLAQNKGKIGLLTNAAVASLTVSNNAYLELAGNTLTVNTLAITNKAYAVGTYTAGQLSALVSDSPGGGSVVVLGAFQGSMFIFR
jgi:hypothetical protein